MIKQYAFYVNPSLCTGCKACQVACKDKSDLPVGVTWRRVVEYAGGTWIKQGNTYTPNVFAYYTSISCNHCGNPTCRDVCPAQAIEKNAEGIVIIDQSKCIGCRYCEWACPYGAPQFNENTGKMSKCDFCIDYLKEGQPPACVASCPSRALDYGELSELQAKYGSQNAVEPLPDPTLTSPALVVAPHPKAQLTGFGTGKISNPEEI